MPINNNKQIAKNTLMLYFRMILTMGVSLFTVRVVLDKLGEVDYGLFNVVGGIVVMFSFLSGTMSAASQRFFSFELGENDFVKLKKTFNITLLIYFIIAFVILLLAETAGLWFLNNKMTIPTERLEAAHYVYHFSILSFIMTVLTIPYNSAIIAHEKMDIYAWVSILEVCLKLLIVYLLVVIPYDKLKIYSILTFTVTSIVTLVYRTYCKRKFSECTFNFIWDKEIFLTIINYSGWNLFGALSNIFKNQGINIMLNIFFSPIVNAARGIAYQVNNSVLNFGNNFFTAVRPQIIKNYAAKKDDELMKLIFFSTKFTYYLLLIIALPILIEPSYILNLWLKNTPENTVLFLRLVIIDMLLEAISFPLVTLVQATGKVKTYQIIVGGTRLLILPIAYLFLKLGYPPESTFYVMIVITSICNIERLVIIKKLETNFKISSYLKEVLFVIITVSLLSILFPFINWKYSLLNKPFFGILIGLACTFISLYIVGISKLEKKTILQLIKKKIKF